MPSPPVRSYPGDVWGTSGNDLWVVGAEQNAMNANVGGVVYHYDGTSWSTYNPPNTTALFAVHGSGACSVTIGGTYYNGTGYQAATLYFDGTAWSSNSSSSVESVDGLWAGEENRSFLVGSGTTSGSGKFGLDDGNHGTTWTVATPTLSFPRTSFRVPGTHDFYVIGDGNGLGQIAHAACN